MQLKKQQSRQRRKNRVRAKVNGTAQTPRMSVYKSNTSVYVQLIDDQKGFTLISVKGDNSNIKSAEVVGDKIAELAEAKKIKTCVFDRNGYKYHGVIKALADNARKGGLKF
jgi:large subunit ribosomal protein L18